jgi:hypothetical protein
MHISVSFGIIFAFLGPTKAVSVHKIVPKVRRSSCGLEFFFPSHSVPHRTGVHVVVGMWLKSTTIQVCHRIVEWRLAAPTPSMAIGLLQRNKVQVLAISFRLYLSQPIRHVPNKCLLCGLRSMAMNSRLCEITVHELLEFLGSD